MHPDRHQPHNDAVDSQRDDDDGPRRTAEGDGVRLAQGCRVSVAFAPASASPHSLGSIWLRVGGWPILMLASCQSRRSAYTRWVWPIAYTPLGEAFVITFSGLAPQWYILALYCDIDGPPLDAGLALRLFTGAVLLVNNLRDVEADARVGRRTLAIIAGTDEVPDLCADDGGTFSSFSRWAALPDRHVWLALIHCR